MDWVLLLTWYVGETQRSPHTDASDRLNFNNMFLPGRYFSKDTFEESLKFNPECPSCNGHVMYFQGITIEHNSVIIVATCKSCRKSIRIVLRSV